jgi:hypothetical protein
MMFAVALPIASTPLPAAARLAVRNDSALGVRI